MNSRLRSVVVRPRLVGNSGSVTLRARSVRQARRTATDLGSIGERSRTARSGFRTRRRAAGASAVGLAVVVPPGWDETTPARREGTMGTTTCAGPGAARPTLGVQGGLRVKLLKPPRRRPRSLSAG